MNAGVTSGWRHQLAIAARLILTMTVLCSIAFPALVTGLAAGLWRQSAEGGLIYKDGQPVGAELIGQEFSSDRYFHPRRSSTGYDPMKSGSANLGPLNDALRERVLRQLIELDEQLAAEQDVPAEWLTESGSGLDPHITPRAARLQVPRVSRATGLETGEIMALIERETQGKWLGLFGLERVNVLRLNLELQERMGESS